MRGWRWLVIGIMLFQTALASSHEHLEMPENSTRLAQDSQLSTAVSKENIRIQDPSPKRSFYLHFGVALGFWLIYQSFASDCSTDEGNQVYCALMKLMRFQG